MTAKTTIDIFCDNDGCYTWASGGIEVSKVTIRRQLKEQGWTQRNRGGRMIDLCPTCSEGKGTLKQAGMEVRE